jgi:GTPase SAR1 family protein
MLAALVFTPGTVYCLYTGTEVPFAVCPSSAIPPAIIILMYPVFVIVLMMVACYVSHSKRFKAIAKLSWIDDYKAICKKYSESSININLTRCLFVGPPGVGKSSLKHLLINKRPKRCTRSTPVLVEPEIVQDLYEAGANRIDWRKVDGQVRHLIIRQKAKEIQVALRTQPICGCCTAICSRCRRHSQGNSTNAMEEGAESSQHYRSWRTSRRSTMTKQFDQWYKSLRQCCCSCFQKSWEKLNEALQDLHQEIDETANSVFSDSSENSAPLKLIHFLDSGGQPVFHDILPLFIGTPCLYIYVFNAVSGLNESLKITYRFEDGSDYAAESTSTARDFMLRTSSSIHTMEQKVSVKFESLLEQSDERDPPQSSILTVATFKDKLLKKNGKKKEADLRESWTTVKESIAMKPYEKLLGASGELFLVNNLMTEANQPKREEDLHTLETLRDAMSTSHAAFDIKIPLLWLLVDLITSKAGIKFIKYSCLEKFCLSKLLVSNKSEFDILVAFMHTLGFFAYFTVDRESRNALICTDAAFLYREVSSLLTVQFKKSPVHTAMRKFKEKAVIDSDYLKLFDELGIAENEIMDRQWFLKFLLHIGIAARLNENSYFIPLALPAQPLAPSTLMEKCDSSVSSLCFTVYLKQATPFESDKHILPQGIYCQLCTYVIRESKWQPLTSNNCRRRITYHMDTRATVALTEAPTHIEVSVHIHWGQGGVDVHTMEKIHSTCTKIKEDIQKGIEAAYESVFSHSPNDVSFALGFACPCQGASKDTHLRIVNTGNQHESARCPCGKITPLGAREVIWFKVPPKTMNASAEVVAVEEQLICMVNSHNTPHGKQPTSTERGVHITTESCEIIENRHVTLSGISAAQKVGDSLRELYDCRLVEAEADMRTKLSLEGLIPLLERPAGGFMTQEERVLVTSASTDPEKVSKIISIIRKKTNEDFVRFCSILDKSGNEHWATCLRHVDSEVEFPGPMPHTKQSLIPPTDHSKSGQNKTPLQATPTLHILDTHVIQHTALDWNKVAENLEIDISILKAIETSYPDNAKHCCYEMFSRWLDHVTGTGDSPRTWKSVLIALRTAGYVTLVGDMEKLLNIEP